jgi:hypothetical protein
MAMWPIVIPGQVIAEFGQYNQIRLAFCSFIQHAEAGLQVLLQVGTYGALGNGNADGV